MKKNLFAKITGIGFPVILFLLLASFIYKNDDSKTISGEILDMKCYMASGAHGDGHKDCSASCINGGAPMGILTDDGKVYLLIKDSKHSDAYDDAKKLAGAKVTATGTVSEKGGVQALIVTEVKAKS